MRCQLTALFVFTIADNDGCSPTVQNSRPCRIGDLVSDPKADCYQFKAPAAARYRSRTPQVPSADRTRNKASKLFRGGVAICVDV